MKSIYLFLFLLFASFTFVSAETYTFSDWQDFKGAITGDDLTPQPGDIFILKDGTYSKKGTATLENINGTADARIIIKAENIGGVIFDEALAFDFRHCSYITFQGFNFELTTKSSVFKLQACNHIRITQNTLDGATETVFEDDGDREDTDWISIQGHWEDDTTISCYNRVDHNVFKNKMTLGNIIKIDGTADLYVSQHDTIEYNYFKNVGPRADNEMETIRIGWSAMSESSGYCVVSNNLFEECDGDPEIISVKSYNNTISHNTFRRCAGTVCLRSGGETLVEGNFFLGEGYTEEAVDGFPDSGDNGSGGIRVYGPDQVIINNYFEGLTGTRWDAPITLTQGDAEVGGGLTNHWRVERAVIANNTLVNNDYGIEIGYDKSGDYDKPARDVVIAYNILQSDTNSLVTIINEPDNMTWLNNVVFTAGNAAIGSGDAFTAFTDDEVTYVNPKLYYDETYYRATDSTPSYTPLSSEVYDIIRDIDGETRSTVTNYGDDEYLSQSPVYYPLTASDVGPSEGEYVYTSLSNISVNRMGATKTISISSNLDWSVSSADSWVTVDPSSGSGDGSFSITIAENTSDTVRTATVTVVSTNHTEDVISNTITISQSNVDAPVLTVSESSLTFTADAQSSEISVTSNLTWTASADTNWISVSPDSAVNSATLTISVQENPLMSSRTGSVTIGDEGTNSQTIAITQEGAVSDCIQLNIISAVASAEQEANPATNVFDSLYSNRWSGEGDSVVITLELDTICEVSYLVVGLYKGDQRVCFFDILTSTDSITFYETSMGNVSTITSDESQIFDFDNVEARYVRLICRGTSTDSEPDVNNPTGLWNSFTEFEVWGKNLMSTGFSIINELDVSVYPNPNNGSFNITAPVSSNISIYNLFGKKVCSGVAVSSKTTISGLESGVYLVRIESEGEYLTRKIIVE